MMRNGSTSTCFWVPPYFMASFCLARSSSGQRLRTVSQKRRECAAVYRLLSGQEPPPPPALGPAVEPWAGTERRDFYMAVQPVQTQGRTFDQDKLNEAFVAARVAYLVTYVANLALLRSLVWMVGIGSAVAIFVAAT